MEQQVQGQIHQVPSSLRQLQNQFNSPPTLQQSPPLNSFSSQQQMVLPPQIIRQPIQNYGRQGFPSVTSQQMQFAPQRPLFPTPHNQPIAQQYQQHRALLIQLRENPIHQLSMMENQERPEALDINSLKNQQEFLHFIETFVDKDNYFCQICHNLLWQPISCAHCSKIYCRDCLGHWVETCSTCPTCRDRFELKKVDKAITNNLSKLTFICNALSNGCEELISYEQLYKHQQTCDFQQIQCKNIGCEFTSIRKEMEDHNQICQHHQIKCKWCERNIKRMNELQHDEICEMKILGCENQGCTVSLTRAEINKHIQECPYNIVGCEMCHQEFIFKDITQHKLICDFKIIQCRGCKQNMFKKQIDLHEHSCEEVELQCPDCTDIIQRKNLANHDQITCLKRGQKILFEEKTQLLCENTILKNEVESLKMCVGLLYEQNL